TINPDYEIPEALRNAFDDMLHALSAHHPIQSLPYTPARVVIYGEYLIEQSQATANMLREEWEGTLEEIQKEILHAWIKSSTLAHFERWAATEAGRTKRPIDEFRFKDFV